MDLGLVNFIIYYYCFFFYSDQAGVRPSWKVLETDEADPEKSRDLNPPMPGRGCH